MLPDTATDATSETLPQVMRGLHAAGFVPRLETTRAGVYACGAALCLPVRELMRSPETAAHTFGRLRRALMSGAPAVLTLNDLGSGPAAQTAFEHVAGRVNRVLSSHCIDRRLLGVAASAGEVAPQDFRRVSRVLLGGGPRYLWLHRAQFAEPAGGAGLWSTLYLQRSRALGVMPVYGAGVRGRCPLLADEASAAVLPGLALPVPPGSAWLPLELDLGRFADGKGELHHALLARSLRRGLALADSLLDHLRWPDALQRDDAHRNRRIAIVLTGTGELAAVRGDVASHRRLCTLDRLLARLHELLWDTSRELAGRRGLLPALRERDPSLAVREAGQRRDWHERWRSALSTAAVRHRNLLVMSPYSLLPRNGANPDAHAELLPLLAHADAVCFSGPPSMRHWNIKQFKYFHERAFAVIERQSAAGFVAAGV